MVIIDNFKGEYFFLSNFFPCNIFCNGRYYKSTEHAYQAAKTTNQLEHDAIANAPTAAAAKKEGRLVTVRSDWNEVRDGIMLEILRAKFSIPELKEKLLATGDAELIEGNWWNDTYWGVCRGKGDNKLGKILIIVREEFKNGTGIPDQTQFT